MNQNKSENSTPGITRKTWFIIFLLIISCAQSDGQVSQDTTHSAQQTTWLLPDGSVLPAGKWDSLENAWGKGRIAFSHTEEDDKKGIVHLVRITDEMIKQMKDKTREEEKTLAALINNPAPAFELKDLGGTQWSLAQLRGKVVVLNFWFTSCAPCIREMPELNQLTKSYNADKVVFLGLSFNKADQVRLFLMEHTFDFVLLPGSASVDEKFHISSWPTSMVIDKKGIVKKIIHSNPEIRKELAASIDSLL